MEVALSSTDRTPEVEHVPALIDQLRLCAVTLVVALVLVVRWGMM